jgi:hypothetical protein
VKTIKETTTDYDFESTSLTRTMTTVSTNIEKVSTTASYTTTIIRQKVNTTTSLNTVCTSIDDEYSGLS